MEQLLESTLRRLLCGLAGESRFDVEYYDGLLADAQDEAEKLLRFGRPENWPQKVRDNNGTRAVRLG